MSDELTRYLPLLARAGPELEDQLVREICEGSLYKFLQEAWSVFDPAPFVGGWHLEAIAEHLQAVSNGQIKKLLINVRPRSGKTGIVAVAWPSWTWALPQNPRFPLHGAGVRFLFGSYGANKAQGDGVTARRLIGSNWYQNLWGDRVVISDDRDNQEQYDTLAGGSRISTGIPESLGKGGIIRCLDDPHKTDEIESEKVTSQVLRNYKEIWETRSNDPNLGAEVMIMQRQGESDLSGYWLEKGGPDLVHLCIPAWYEDDRKCVTYVNGHEFWADPREVDGESFWPRRYGLKQRAVDEGLGDFAFCTPTESPVLMGDLSLRPIGQIKVGDYVIGFERPPSETLTGQKRRNILTQAKVLAISRSIRPVVKITLDSGETARCTADHKWYRRARGPDRPRYLPADIGAPLARVCAPIMPTIKPEQERLAGWLAGFFDGEGSLSKSARPEKGTHGNFSSASLISFTQGAGRNLPLCEKLEAALTEFGFSFNYCGDWRKENARDQECKKLYECRFYYLTGKCLEMFQKFLHVVQPVKWRDRFIESAMRGKFIKQYERVVSIEPDGEEEVFGLTTETGNYVVWGLASSNSGQIQQRPAPRGGGILRREWWQPWPPDDAIEQWTNDQGQVTYPPWEFVLAYLDTAFTKKEENDWCAMSRWGVFGDSAGRPRAMMAGAWRERMNFRELIAKSVDTCRAGKVDVLVIENKAGGSWVAEEIVKEMHNGEWQVVLDTPKVDKVARTHAVVPLFVDRIVHAPFMHDKGVWRAWAEMVIAESEVFPKGRHDDLHDTVTGALGYLRRNDLIKLSNEHDDDEREARVFKGNDGGVARLYGVG